MHQRGNGPGVVLAATRKAEYVDELERYYAGERPSKGVSRPAPLAVSWQGDHGLDMQIQAVADYVSSNAGK